VDVLVLIERLGEVVDHARWLPFSGDVRIDRRMLDEVREGLRTALPEELDQARAIVEEGDAIVAEARRGAERALAEADERQDRLVAAHERVQEAKAAADELLAVANMTEEELRRGADDYADDAFATLEAGLGDLIVEVRRGREHLQRPQPTGAAA
jgi:seryl-tRNA synthetase